MVDGHDDREKYYESDDQELEHGGDHRSEEDLRSFSTEGRDRRHEGFFQIRRIEQRADQGIEDICHQRGDDSGERRADDDTDGEIDHVTAKDEIFETFEHGEPPLLTVFENYEPVRPVGAFDGAEPDFGAGEVDALASPFDLPCSDFFAAVSDFVAGVDSDEEPDEPEDDSDEPEDDSDEPEEDSDEPEVEPEDDLEVSARLSFR